MLNTTSFGFCNHKEIESFYKNGVSLSSTIRRTCPIPIDRTDMIWSKEQIKESFERFSLKFSPVRSNGCKVSNSFIMEREVESEFFYLLLNLRNLAQTNISFSFIGDNEVATANADADIDVFCMLYIVRSGLVCIYIPLVESFCNDLHCPESMIHDTRSECMCSLIKSVELFNPFKYNKFSTYAYAAFSNTFRDAIRSRNSQYRLINGYTNKVVRSNPENMIIEPKISDVQYIITDIIAEIRNNPVSLGLTEIEVKCILCSILDDGDDDRTANEKAISLGVSRGTLKNKTISALKKIKSNIVGALGIS